MRKEFLPLLILILVALCPGYVHAQLMNPGEAELREKAYQLLETLAGQVNTMQSPENRARIASNIAWSLWPRNEARARELFALVQQDINAGLQVRDPADREDSHTLLVFLSLRADTITRITKYDPELAYDFFKATALSPDLKISEAVRAGERAHEIELAKRLAPSNPDVALQLGRKMLANGLPDDLRRIVRQLNRKHKTHASALYRDIVQKLSEVDLTKNSYALQFALTLANSLTPPEIDEESFTRLVNLFVKAAVANGCQQKMDDEDDRADVCRLLGPAVALIEKVNPSRAAQLDQWRGNGNYYWGFYNELEETLSDLGIEAALALTAKYPQMEVQIRWRVFQRALDDRDFEAARKIATATNANPELQKEMLSQVGMERGQIAIDDEKLADVQRRFNQIKGTEQQVIFLAATADQIGDQNPKEAIKLLNQASSIVDSLKPGREQLSAQIGLAIVYCSHNSERGFAIMEGLIPKLNELVEASAKLDGLERRYLSDGEWDMSGEGTLGGILTALAQNAGFFSRLDFDRAVNLSSQFNRSEIRIMAQLKLAQGVLAGPPRRLFSRYSRSFR